MPEYTTRGNKPKIYPNWMSQVDSPTYKLTLYIVDHTVWNDPTRLVNDEQSIRAGHALIVAQSGTTTNYHIDNLTMLSRLSPSNKAGSTNTGIFQFEILEPLGFKFIDRVTSLSKYWGFKNLQSANWCLKIEFQGRSEDQSRYTPYPGVFMYSIFFSQISATTGPEGTRYNITAINQLKYANTESVVKADLVVEKVNKVSNWLTQITDSLNRYEEGLRKAMGGRDTFNKKRVTKKTWKVSLGKSLSSSSPKDDTVRAQNWAFGGTANADKAGGQSASSNPDYRDLTINAETNMTSWLAATFAKDVPEYQNLSAREKEKGIRSPYIVVEPKVTFGEEIDPYTNERELHVDLVIEMKWTYTNPQRDASKHSKNLRDSNFQTTRFLELPITKMYHYFYTGKNTEVMDFKLQFNQLFANAIDPGMGQNYGEPSQLHSGTNLNDATAGRSSHGIIRYDNQDSPPKTLNNIRYLEDLIIDQNNLVLETPVYAFSMLGASKQKVNETKNNSKSIETIREEEYAKRDVDFTNLEMQIKGDPFWMGTPGAVIDDRSETLIKYLTNDVLIGFINHMPDNSVFDPAKPTLGAFDMSSSGIYRIIEVESRFQQGQFIQKLIGMKDRNTSLYYVRDLLVMLEYNNRQ